MPSDLGNAFSELANKVVLEKICAPFKSLKPVRGKTQRALLIICDPKATDPTTGAVISPPTFSQVAKMFKPLNDYFSENSGGRFRVLLIGNRAYGPYNTAHQWSHYEGAVTGWDNAFHQRYPIAICTAATEFNFPAYLKNWRKYHPGDDKRLYPEDLAIIIITPQAGSSRGFCRMALFREKPWQPLELHGITFAASLTTGYHNIIDMYVHDTTSDDALGGIAHELAHLILGHADMYNAFTHGYQAGTYSIMDDDHQFCHLDPFAKLKLGWVTPKLEMRAGEHTLKAIETAHEVLVLASPKRGSDEYFIIENRCPNAGSFDRNLPDSGLAIWHIIEDPKIYGAIAPPPGVTKANWNSISSTDWGRRGIRLIRRQTSPVNDAVALWHGPSSKKVDLFWADGKRAFILFSISGAGPKMSFSVGYDPQNFR